MAKSEHGVRTPKWSKKLQTESSFQKPKTINWRWNHKKKKTDQADQTNKKICIKTTSDKENGKPLPRKWNDVQWMNWMRWNAPEEFYFLKSSCLKLAEVDRHQMFKVNFSIVKIHEYIHDWRSYDHIHWFIYVSMHWTRLICWLHELQFSKSPSSILKIIVIYTCQRAVLPLKFIND